MKKIIIGAISAAVIISIIIAVLAFYKPGTGKEFQFVKLAVGDIRNTVTCTGTLEFTDERDIMPLASGIVNGVFTDFNKKVKKGELLATIDDALLRLSVSEARTALDKVNADRVTARKTLDETKALFEKNFKSRSNLDTAYNAFQAAETAAETAKLALNRAEINLGYARIASPMTGVIVARNIDVGQQVSAGGTTPAFIVAADTSKMRALASVDENDISKVSAGQKVLLNVQSLQDVMFEGTVSQVRLMPTVVQNVVNYTVIVDLANRDEKLLPGMTATIDIIIEEKTGVLRVPHAALRFNATPEMFHAAFADGNGGKGRGKPGDGSINTGEGGNGRKILANGGNGGSGQSAHKRGDLVWVLDETTNKVKPVRVRPGITDGQWTEVASDSLSEGMQVVTGYATAKRETATGNQNRSPFQQQRGGFGGPGFH